MDFVHRQSNAATYVDPTTGVVYEQLGDTILNFGNRGGIVGRTTNAAQPSSEWSENIAQFTSDASFLLGPSDRADIPIEMPSFANVTIRRKPIDFLGGLPSFLTVDTTGGAWSVPSDATYGQLLRLTTGPGRSKLYLPGLKMALAPQHKLLLMFWPKQSGRQFIEYGFHDNLGANHITMQRVDAAGEGAWWGVVRINNAAPVYVPLTDPAGGPYKSGMGRKFIAISVVSDGVEFIGGAAAHNEGCVVGKYTGPRPTAGLHPYLSIESTDGVEKVMDVTHGEVVWPG
jgi:hypothetical protein